MRLFGNQKTQTINVQAWFKLNLDSLFKNVSHPSQAKIHFLDTKKEQAEICLLFD